MKQGYCFVLSILLLSGSQFYAQEGFPSLGVGKADQILERATNLELPLQETLRLFTRSVQRNEDPRAILCYTRALNMMITVFRTNLTIRYSDREFAPVQPKITNEEAEQLRSFIYHLLELQAQLIAFEEVVLKRVAQQRPELEQKGVIKRWRNLIQRARQVLTRRSELTGLQLTKFPKVSWEERHQLVKRLNEDLRECDCIAHEYRSAEVKVPQHLERFVQAPLPWAKEE